MIFKGPASKTIHRLGHAFASDKMGNLEIDIDSLKTKIVEIDAEGAEFTTKERLSSDDKAELLSAIKAYGFAEVKEADKAEKTK